MFIYLNEVQNIPLGTVFLRWTIYKYEMFTSLLQNRRLTFCLTTPAVA